MSYSITPIATVHSPYKQKFGIARQPSLVPAAKICIELTPEFTADSVRGLEDFDYVWISFIFHGVLDEGWAQWCVRHDLEANKKWAYLPRVARTAPIISVYPC